MAKQRLSDDRHCAVFLARGPYGNLHVLPERGEKIHEPFDREGAGAVAHQRGHVGLLDAEDLSGFRLGKAALVDEPINLQCQPGFQEFLFWMGKAEVGEDIPAAFSLFGSRGHASSAFLCGDARPQPGGGG